MSTAALSGNDEAVYDEIAVKKFSMEENVCYEGITPYSSNLRTSAAVKGASTEQDKKCSKRMHVALFFAVLALLLGTICGCAAFALVLKFDHEITNLKEQMNMISQLYDENTQHQNTSSLIEQVNSISQLFNEKNWTAIDSNLTQMNLISQLIMNSSLFGEKIRLLNTSIESNLKDQMNLISQLYDENTQHSNTSSLIEQVNSISQLFAQKIRLLNTSIESNLMEQMNLISQLIMNSSLFAEKIQLLNTSIASSLTEQVNLISQLIMSFSLCDEKIQHLNTSIDLFYHQFSRDVYNMIQQLNASAVLFNQQHSATDEKIELLNTSSQNQLRQLDSRILELSYKTELTFDTLSLFHTTNSCAAYPPSSPSGYYMIQPSIDQPAVRVYCDFNRQCGCGASSTWTRVAFLNMSDPNEVCPTNWETYTSPVRACGNGPDTGGCDSTIYSTFGLTYSRVCGRVIAYQHHCITLLACTPCFD